MDGFAKKGNGAPLPGIQIWADDIASLNFSFGATNGDGYYKLGTAITGDNTRLIPKEFLLAKNYPESVQSSDQYCLWITTGGTGEGRGIQHAEAGGRGVGR